MKDKRLWFGILLLTGAVLFQARSQDAFTNGLVVYYPLNGNANDASGNGNHGVAYAVVNAVDRFGQPSSAFDFNGTNAYIWIGTNVRPSPISASVWFLTSATTNLDGREENMLLRDRFHGWHLQVNVPQYAPKGALDAGISRPDGDYSIATDPGYNDGQWHMATMTYNGYTISIYVDGFLKQQQTLASYQDIAFDPGGLAIGRDGDQPGSYFQGRIDDVRIYNRALSGTEVQRLYAFESGRPYTGVAKAVRLDYEFLQVGTNYQLQVSHDFGTWTNLGSPFTATSSTNSQYLDVADWNAFFRLTIP